MLFWLTCFVPLGTSKWQLVMRPTSALTMCQATHSHYTFSKAFYIYIEWTNSWMDKFLFNYPNDGNFQTGHVILTCPSRQSDDDTTELCSKILRCRHQWLQTPRAPPICSSKSSACIMTPFFTQILHPMTVFYYSPHPMTPFFQNFKFFTRFACISQFFSIYIWKWQIFTQIW